MTKKINFFGATFILILSAVIFIAFSSPGSADEPPYGSGLTRQNPAAGLFSAKKYSELLKHDRAGTDAYNKNDFNSALKELRRSVELSTGIFGENSGQTAHRCNSLALTHYHRGEYDQAILYYERVLRIYHAVADGNSIRAAFCYHGLGQCYQFKGQYDRTIEYLTKALAIYKRDDKKNRQHAGTAYYDIGVAYQFKGEYARAENYFNQSLGIYKQEFGPDHAHLATVYYALGEISKFRGVHNSALGYYQKALGIYLKAYGDNHPFVGTAYYAMAYAFENTGEFERAVTYYERARQIYTAAYGEKHPHVAISFHGLGNVYNIMEECDKAIPYFEKAVEIYLAVFGEDHINTAASLHGLGSSYQCKGQYDRALLYFERTLAIHRKVLGENHPETGHSNAGIGLVLKKTGRYDQALRYYETARAIFAGAMGEGHPNVSYVLLLTGQLYLSMGNFERAGEYLERALAHYREKSFRTQIIAASNSLGFMHLDAGNFSKARVSFDDSIHEIEKFRAEAGSNKVEFMRRYIGSYYYSLRASAGLNDLEAVFRTAESMRARGFLDRLSLSTALSVEGIRKADRDRLIALNDDIETLASRRSAEIQKPLSGQDRVRLVRISREIEEKDEAFKKLDARLMDNEKYRRMRRPHIATLVEARGLCDADTAILEYIIWEEKDPGSLGSPRKQSYCLIITKRGQSLVALDRDFDYSGAIAKYREAIIGQNRNRDSLGTILYEKLIAPLEKALPGVKNIIIIPDGALAFLPFDALRKEERGPFLCERYSVTLSPSVSVMLMVNKRRYGHARKQLLAFGGAVYSAGGGEKRGKRRPVQSKDATLKSKEYLAGEGGRGRALYYRNLGLRWDNIPGTLDEVVEIEKNIYNKKNTRVIKGTGVSEKNIKELSRKNELVRYKVVHFACHGYFDPDLPSYSAVILSEVSGRVKTGEDGYLSVPEVALLKLKADIVNLSACETGLGKIVQGDGIVGLARAFQEAGANRVGVTLWEVADDPTRKFMVRAYRKAVRIHMPYGAAVTETKREFIKSKEHGDPYFWSPFVLYGR